MEKVYLYDEKVGQILSFQLFCVWDIAMIEEGTNLLMLSEFELSTPLSIKVVVLSDIGDDGSGSETGFSGAQTWAVKFFS